MMEINSNVPERRTDVPHRKVADTEPEACLVPITRLEYIICTLITWIRSLVRQVETGAHRPRPLVKPVLMRPSERRRKQR